MRANSSTAAAIIEVVETTPELTLRQRWSHFFVLVNAGLCIQIGINLRESSLYAAVPYANAQVGITAFYPRGWLIDTEGSYVFRVRDMLPQGYKTAMQVDVLPVNQSNTPRNINDNLVLRRSQPLSTYSILAQDALTIGDGVPATQVTYTFVAGDQDPFLESLPRVVEGIDVLAIEGGQAIIVTFLTDAANFDETYPIFQQFLSDLDF